MTGLTCHLTWTIWRLPKGFVRKMPPPGQVVIDKQTEEEYDARYWVYYFQDSTPAC